jgi:orotidine-5'-phosphate decarboxylase
MHKTELIAALDTHSLKAAGELMDRLEGAVKFYKIGSVLFTAEGPAAVDLVHKRGGKVFLDLKFHDIPNTVAHACAAAARLGVWMVNVHALGGRRMLEAARDALERVPNRPRLIAVTMLTSLATEDLAEIGLNDASPAHAVLRLAALTQSAGLDGVVCSAQEAAALRAQCGPTFDLVTPGIRPAESNADDQARIMTPRAAIAAGASYLVIGRPITKAADPVEALARIAAEISA